MKLVEKDTKPPRRSQWGTILLLCGAAVIAAGGGYYWYARPAPRPVVREAPPVPVTVAEAATQNVPIYLDGLGTVSASNTVAIRSQITGTLQSVNFTEGQEVHKGDTLATIDPRPLQAALTQAVAKKAQDQAQLVSAQKDLTRFTELAKRDNATQQSVDQQVAKVDQLKGMIEADQGAIESAQTQLSYATITAPFDGNVGFRQLDAGNIIHPTDAQPLTVLTQIKPAMVTFTLPQKNLGDVREAMLRGGVTVLAYDQDGAKELSSGELLLIDNQIDQATSTIRLKARFANADTRLWPGEFVRIRAQVDAKQNAITIPPSALQRGPNGLYAWVIKPDNTAEQRYVEATTPDGNTVIVTKGLNAGEKVVVNGAYRVQVGTRVDAKPEGTTEAAAGNQ
ncbi:MAG: efflux RND transporter periplasmic adaptor subunit [Alphaproteobacteria bacterium]|nr:efflux RND transporter periplasmic adaptor subunit [Alphaproteobacteria bacterium]